MALMDRNQQVLDRRMIFDTGRSFNRIVFAESGAGMSLGGQPVTINPFDLAPMALNPVADFAEHPDDSLALIELMACHELTGEKRALARQVGIEAAQDAEPNLLLLVQAWEKEPALTNFATAVRRAAIPS